MNRKWWHKILHTARGPFRVVRNTRVAMASGAVVLLIVVSAVGVMARYAGIPGRGVVRVRTSSGLACNESVWDLGEVDATDQPTVSHAFILTNESEKPLHIETVHSSCGCLVSDGRERVIAPTDSATLNAQIAIAPTPGRFVRTLAITVTADPVEHMFLTVRGIAKINASLRASPQRVNVGAIPSGQVVRRLLRIDRQDGSPVRVTDTACEGPGLDASVAMSAENQAYAEVGLQLDTSHLPLGPFSGAVTVRTAHEQFADIRVSVVGEVRSPDLGLVQSLFIDDLGPEESRDIRLWESEASEQRGEIVSAEYRGDSRVSVELLDAEKGASQGIVRIRRRGDLLDSGVARGTLSVQIQGRAQSIEIPVVVCCFNSKDVTGGREHVVGTCNLIGGVR